MIVLREITISDMHARSGSRRDVFQAIVAKIHQIIRKPMPDFSLTSCKREEDNRSLKCTFTYDRKFPKGSRMKPLSPMPTRYIRK